ncbi:major facilitator superfamily domain-containing protein [Aspergillus karnatakaensis]|uniref:putative MFS multidrug transporter n=1 Tax=Aspergillus karnatakaensis TaxID=1810916 RepID=UPI003CCCE252
MAVAKETPSSEPSEPSESSDAGQPSPASPPALSALRTNIIVLGLWISLFLSSIDSTIISTSVFAISNDLHGSSQSSWIVTAYLLTYNAFVLILAKLSDLVGLKPLLLISNVAFLVFSIACAVAQTIEQLIVFRALQGIGASGLYCLVFVAILQLISLEKSGLYSGIISSVFALSNLLGPLLGGLIVDNTTWRWIFYINIPLGALAIVILALAMPGTSIPTANRQTLARLDTIGAILSVGWLIPLLFALEEGGSHHTWSSSVIIGTLTAGFVALVLFLAYESWVDYRAAKKTSAQESIFPIRFLRDPLQGLFLATIFLTGFAFYTSIITLPQRFQSVNAVSAARSGVLLLALTLCLPFFSLVAGMVLGKKPQWTMHVFLVGTVLMLTATACLSDLDTGRNVANRQFGFQVIMGAGLGGVSTAQYFALKILFPPSDTASATGAMNMLRALGGCVGLAISTAMLSTQLSNNLSSFLTGDEVARVRASWAEAAGTLSTNNQDAVRTLYGQGYNKGFQVMIAFTGANVLVCALLGWVWRRGGGVERMLEAVKAANANAANRSGEDVAGLNRSGGTGGRNEERA